MHAHVLRHLRRYTALLLSVPLLAAAVPAQQRSPLASRPRLVITADPELDDSNTLIRALLYTPDFQLEGLVYASSQFHWRGNGKGTTQLISGREYTRLGLCPCTSWRFPATNRFIDDVVDAYAKVYPNLKVHDPRYPTPQQLRSKIKWGNVDFEGDFSHDTDGSNLIKSLLLDDRPGPLYVTAQGGESTIARALKSIHDQFVGTPRWESIRDKVSRKLVIVPMGDQDDTDAAYIRPNWPAVREYQFYDINYGYGAQLAAPQEARMYFSPDWTAENILSRGPLGAPYRVWGDGKRMVKDDPTDYFGLAGYNADQLARQGYFVWMPPQPKGSFLSEGDTPTFLNFVDTGLRAWENPEWGGWGGRMVPGAPAPAFSATPPPVLPADTSGIGRGVASAASITGKGGPRAPGAVHLLNFEGRPVPARTGEVIASFLAAAQNDFAARLLWSITPKFKDGNHPPHVTVRGPLDLRAAPGSTVSLSAEASDPDHDHVTTRWWQYNDAGTYPGDVVFADPTALATTFRVPDDAKPSQTIHVVLEATDNGTPHLTRYQRVIVTVQ